MKMVLGSRLLKYCSLLLITAAPCTQASHDLDGDGAADLFMWRPSNQTFYTWSTQTASIVHRESMGSDQDEVPLVGDVNGNGISDLGLWDPTTGLWTLVYDDGSRETVTHGESGDIPLLMDYNGDGRDELVVRRPDTFEWIILDLDSGETESVVFGKSSEDIPVVADYDGDGIDDLAVRRPSTQYWFIKNSSGVDSLTDNADGLSRFLFGKQSTDIPVTGDFDGDGKADVAVRRPSNFTWYINNSSGSDYNSSRNDGVQRIEFGRNSEDVPIPADYDGDGITDVAVRRVSNFTWYVRNSSGNNFNSSRNDGIQRVTFGKRAYDIPAIAPWFVKQDFLLESTVADSEDETPPDDPAPDDPTAEEYYRSNVSASIVQGRCIACHIQGGVADGLSRLLFVNSDTPDYQAINQQAIADFLALDGVDANYLLGKASGGQGHVGGAQIPVGGEEYQAFEIYLNLLTGSDSSSTGDDEFWQDAVLQSPDLTLRRAGLLFGSYPSNEALASANTMSDDELRDTILNMMQGENFYDFIVRGANDRLLVEGVPWGILDSNTGYYPELNHKLQEARDADSQEVWDAFREFENHVHEGFYRAPLELIAYIIENERPYTEILTADYTMLNPFTNEAFRGDATGFINEEDVDEFRPGKVHGIMVEDGTGEFSYEDGFRIIEEATNVSLPHAGLLNNHSWLARYPTTATNRNRARARWTYYHFLDFDIEKSVARTQDSDDLADIDNPTMNNPNCSACHELLDPIAGAYKFYYERGGYLESGGADSLFNSYKIAPDSPYQEGDTWYRGMRDPGFEGQDVPDSEHPMQWLAQQMVADPRFAISAIKFWWPAIMGIEPLSLPENASDDTYQAQLEAYTQQKTYINQLAEEFKEHWNIKRVFAELVLSPWYRVESYVGAPTDVQAEKYAGTGALLGPERLDDKTKLVTGINWIGEYSIPQMTEGEFGYRLTYGGINSVDITKRAVDMTSMMSQVALTQAAELACPVVVNEFMQPQNERRFLHSISRLVNPQTVKDAAFQVEANSADALQTYEFDFNATKVGQHEVSLYSMLGSDSNEQRLVIASVTVRDDQQNLVYQASGDDYRAEHCWGEHPDGTPLERRCGYMFEFDISATGDYQVSIEAINYDSAVPAASRAPVTMEVSVTANESLGVQPYGEAAIKQALVDMHYRFLGEKLETTDAAIAASYSLFSQLLAQAQSRDGGNYIEDYGTRCSFNALSEEGSINSLGQYVTLDVGEFDPVHTLKAWRGMVAFMLSDHKFIHDY